MPASVLHGRKNHQHSRPSEPSPTDSSPSRHASMQLPFRRYCIRKAATQREHQERVPPLPMMDKRVKQSRVLAKRRCGGVHTAMWKRAIVFIGRGWGGRGLECTFPLVHRLQAVPAVVYSHTAQSLRPTDAGHLQLLPSVDALRSVQVNGARHSRPSAKDRPERKGKRVV